MTSGPAPARPVLVVDYGAQYAQLITRRIREAGVYAELVPHDEPLARLLAREPVAVVLSGGPASVYADGAPAMDAGLLEAGVPVLGICYGFQLMAHALGGTVARTGTAEYGGTPLEVTAGDAALFSGLPDALSVWMSHGDAVTEAPPGFRVTARTAATPVAAFEDRDRRLAGVQFHPEVRHCERGQDVLERFLFEVAGLAAGWDTAGIVAEQIAAVQAQVGSGRAICGLSGGVDSAVAAALVQRAPELRDVEICHPLVICPADYVAPEMKGHLLLEPTSNKWRVEVLWTCFRLINLAPGIVSVEPKNPSLLP
jgi:GMP synthase (glutamine-hydrolysing)